MNVGNALKVTCVGFAGGVLLRVVQMLFFYDYETGFYTDNGLMAWICLGFVVISSLLACVMCFRSRRYFGPYVPRKNTALGVVSVLSGAALLASSVLQFLDYMNYQKTGASAYDSTKRGAIHVAFIVACLLFGVIQFYVSLGFFQGKNNLARVPLLYLAAVVWGVAYLVLVYVFYAKSSSFVENFFAVIGGASTLLALFYLCKLLAGVDEEGAAKRLFVAGICAVIFTVTYSFANLALLLLGKSYSGEIPAMTQLSSLGVAFFLLVFLVTFRKYSLRSTPKSGPQRIAGREREVSSGQKAGEEKKSRGGRRFRPN